ncbi:MAG: triphosphoribosyl-dephospho-CoA synthase, partial [Bacillota bacterium]
MSTAMNFHKKVEETCIYALMEEVAATPKPGLVDTLNNGAHKDMDYFTFIASIDAIG